MSWFSKKFSPYNCTYTHTVEYEINGRKVYTSKGSHLGIQPWSRWQIEMILLRLFDEKNATGLLILKHFRIRISFFFCSVKVVQILFYTFTLTTIFSLCNGRISGLWATSLKSKNYKWDRTLYYDMITALHTACCILKKWQEPHDFTELKQHNLFTSYTFQPNLLSY